MTDQEIVIKLQKFLDDNKQEYDRLKEECKFYSAKSEDRAQLTEQIKRNRDERIAIKLKMPKGHKQPIGRKRLNKYAFISALEANFRDINNTIRLRDQKSYGSKDYISFAAKIKELKQERKHLWWQLTLEIEEKSFQTWKRLAEPGKPYKPMTRLEIQAILESINETIK